MNGNHRAAMTAAQSPKRARVGVATELVAAIVGRSRNRFGMLRLRCGARPRAA
jgi:hypothetical protein